MKAEIKNRTVGGDQPIEIEKEGQRVPEIKSQRKKKGKWKLCGTFERVKTVLIDCWKCGKN